MILFVFSLSASFSLQESRLGGLLAELDERESKLRQHQSILKEEESHWQQAIVDLTKREELVKEWQDNHKHREKRLKDSSEHLDKYFKDLNQREAQLSEREQQMTLRERSVMECEQRAAALTQRGHEMEIKQNELQEVLSKAETDLALRDKDLSEKEKEGATRRRELEQLEGMLRDKEKKLLHDQKALDEKEERLKGQEISLKAELSLFQMRAEEVTEREQRVELLEHRADTLRRLLFKKEKSYQQNQTDFESEKKMFKRREDALLWKEREIVELEQRYESLGQREGLVEQQIVRCNALVDSFLHQGVEKIFALHNKEMKDMEELLQQQLQLLSEMQLQHNTAIASSLSSQDSSSGNDGVINQIPLTEAEVNQVNSLIKKRNEVMERVQNHLAEREQERQSLESRLATDTVSDQRLSSPSLNLRRKPSHRMGIEVAKERQRGSSIASMSSLIAIWSRRFVYRPSSLPPSLPPSQLVCSSPPPPLIADL
jgi:hypothetical protein